MKKILNKLLKLTSAQKIAISFLVIIAIGTFLLYLPITHCDDIELSLIDALFIATSATCVTGLTPVSVIETFNILGQIVLLILMQIGGIGVIAIVISFLYSMKKKLSIKNNKMIKNQFGYINLSNKRSNIQEMLKYILAVEFIGAILLSFYFIPKHGLLDGLFNSLFISVSAFCNAGFDVLTSSSLIPYTNEYYPLIIIMMLIILGGLGFVVWFDVCDNIKKNKCKKGCFQRFSLHTRVVILTTVFLIVLPALFIFVLECSSEMFADLNLSSKILNSLFTSVSLRTAGFTTCDLSLANDSSLLLMIVCMFIGGSPGGTAGGIKTTTIVIILMYIFSTIKGDEYTNIHKRRISENLIKQAITIFAINIFVLLTGVFLLTITENLSFIEILFEATSAIATVGLSMNTTSKLTVFGKMIISFMMYLGRIGILTFVLSFAKDKNKQHIKYATGNLLI